MAIHRIGSAGYPVLLIHSINAAPSAHEVWPVAEALAASRAVAAPDLPGFGRSDRSERAWTPALFADAVGRAAAWLARDTGAPAVDAMALSLSCEFLIRAAVARPSAFRRLALVSPTGFGRGAERLRRPEGSVKGSRAVHALLAGTPLGRGLYRLLVRRPVIRYFLKGALGGTEPPAAMVDAAWRTAQAPGAHRAPLAFLSGLLFSADLRSLCERVPHPVRLIHGARGDFTDYAGTDWARGRPGWSVTPLPTGALPWFEDPDGFARELIGFLDGADSALAAAGAVPADGDAAA